MSLTYESPTQANGQNDAYFTPMNMPKFANNKQANSATSTPTTTSSANEAILNTNNGNNNNLSNNNSSVNTPYYTAPINPALHQEFLNAIHARHASQPTVLTTPPFSSPTATLNTPPLGTNPGGFNLSLGALASRRQNPAGSAVQPQIHQQRQQQQQLPASASNLTPIEAANLNQLLNKYKDTSSMNTALLVLDVRSFVQYSHSRIRGSINVSIPNTILKRPTFTLDKVYEAIVLDNARERLRSWNTAEYVVFYDQQSQIALENSASAYLASKLSRAGFNGQLLYLKGGFDSFSSMFKESCESNATSSNNGNGNSAASHFGPPTIGGDSFSLKLPASKGARPKLRLNNMPMAPTLGPFTAPMPQFENQAFNPFFSNIRQNMELSHGPIRERFPVRLPPKCYILQDSDRYVQISKDIVPRGLPSSAIVETEQAGDMDKHDNSGDDSGLVLFKPPKWLFSTIGEAGTQLLAQTYEKLERTEQRRLQNIMHFHSKHTDNPAEFPFSIVAGIEMGALNRYTNIWPFEYTRVKIREPTNGSSDYINASYVQYIDTDDCVSDARPEQINTQAVSIMKECADNRFNPQQPCSRYISTQGPLPTTFNDFWQVVWEQNSRVLVMLTKEEEMNKIKCHRYWPTQINTPTQYGGITLTLTSETVHQVEQLNSEVSLNEDDVVIVRCLTLTRGDDTRDITHLQYTGWMDFGVPDNPLGTLQIIQTADKIQSDYSRETQNPVGPMIVHCSAGCGRSGAFCAIDTVIYRLSTALNDGSMDDSTDILLQTIARFREQRLSMVQTLRQFVFCYEAIWWWILGYGLHSDRSKRLQSLSIQADSMDTSP